MPSRREQRIIRKQEGHWRMEPYLRDYEEARRSFSWEAARAELDGLPGGSGLNIAHEAVNRHAAGRHATRAALRFLRTDGRVSELSYRELAAATNRFANVLGSLGVGKGDVVASLLGRVPEFYVTALGALKNRSLLCPLFSAFGPAPIRTRLALGKARVLVTTAALYGRKVAQIRDALPDLAHVILVPGDTALPAGTASWDQLMSRADGGFSIGPTDPEDAALLQFTSGTTGAPKGALHVHAAVVAHHASAKLALDLHPEDVFWCTADPGWVTGVSYGVIAPLTIGATLVVDEGEFDVERWYRTLEDQGVTVWYSSPTAVRMMMKCGDQPARARDLSRLRFMASVGEPLGAQAVVWAAETLGLCFHDNWWQTETGSIMIANFLATDVKPGSMGRPLPGIEAAVVRRRGGCVEVIEESDVTGELALRAGWPSMFRGYLGDAKRYGDCFAGGWYLTGDLVARDGDGYFWFIGRGDDVIKSCGHLVGPVEVESALREHPAVLEAAAIGMPDPVAMEVVKVFVELAPNHQPTENLRQDLLGFARRRLGAAMAPRAIDFRKRLPRTRSGKILRRLLKARELGLPEGDTSTVEDGK